MIQILEMVGSPGLKYYHKLCKLNLVCLVAHANPHFLKSIFLFLGMDLHPNSQREEILTTTCLLPFAGRYLY